MKAKLVVYNSVSLDGFAACRRIEEHSMPCWAAAVDVSSPYHFDS